MQFLVPLPSLTVELGQSGRMGTAEVSVILSKYYKTIQNQISLYILLITSAEC